MREIGLDDFNRFVGITYDAAFGEASWQDVLSEIGSAIGAGSAAALWFADGGQRLVDVQMWGVDPAIMEEYSSHYIAFCPRLRLGRSQLPGAVFDDRSARNSFSPLNREYYDFMDRNDSGLARIVAVERNVQTSIGISFYGPVQDRNVDVDNKLLSALAPHLQKAAKASSGVAELRSRADLNELLGHMLQPAALMSVDGRVLLANGSFEAILRERDGLSVNFGKLHASISEVDRRFSESLRLLSQDRSSYQNEISAFLVRRPSGKPSYIVTLTNVRQSISRFGRSTKVIIARVAETGTKMAPNILRTLFGLSKVEVEVATAISCGSSIDQISEQRGTSVHTTRTQVKAILSKMDVKSQAQLAAFVASVATIGTLPTNTGGEA